MAGPWHDSFLTDLADVEALNDCKDLSGDGPNSGGHVAEDRLSARRLHKADRERLRRDKLNEQFLELANALDPERPKNDKATILGESIQVVKDLREEVKKLKTEHASLLDESAELTQEKNELREEKVSLKNETECLQRQMQQRLRSSSPWMPMDPALMMGAAAAYPYPIPVPHPVSIAQSDSNQVGGPRAPLVSHTPFMPMAPPVGSYHMHTISPYAMFGNRVGDGCNPFMPFSGFPPPVTAHSHIERPYAQYPSSVQQPVPGYAIQISTGPGSQSSPSAGSTLYKPCVPGIPVIPSPNRASSPLSKDSNDHSPTSQSSSQHMPADLEQENVEVVAVDDAGSPVKQDAAEAAGQSPEVKDADVDLCQSNVLNPPLSVSTVKGKMGFFLEKGSFFTEGQVKDLAGDLEAEHDPTLRPPAA
eukprot:c19407_g1_i1 orf=844-2100(+)